MECSKDRLRAALLAVYCLVCVPFGAAAQTGTPYFKIQVVDRQTGRGVPLVELETVHHVRYVTDSGGIVAFDEPGLMNQEVFFFVRSHGYTVPKDAFNFRGVRLQVRAGGSAKIAVQRVNIASLRSTGLSAMPEGLEEKISLQAMADLLAYLNSIK